MKWPFNKTKTPVTPKGMFDEVKGPRIKPKGKSEEDVELDTIMASVRERILPKRVTAESIHHKEGTHGATLVRLFNRMLGKKDLKREYEIHEERLLKAIAICKERKALTRDEWEENRIEVDKVLKKYMEAAVRYAEDLYDEQTAKPLNRATNKFVKE